jgi:hypothetical protein
MSFNKKLHRQGFVFGPANDKGADAAPDHGSEADAQKAMGITADDFKDMDDADGEWDNLEDAGDGQLTTNHGENGEDDILVDKEPGEFDNDALEEEFENDGAASGDQAEEEDADQGIVAVDYDALAAKIVEKQAADAKKATEAANPPANQQQAQFQQQEAADRQRLAEIADLRLVDPLKAEELFLQLTEDRAERKAAYRNQVQSEASRLRDSMVAEMAGDDADARAYVLSQIGDLSVDQLNLVRHGEDDRYRKLLALSVRGLKAEKVDKQRQSAPGKAPRMENGRPAPRTVQVSRSVQDQIDAVASMGAGVDKAEAHFIVTGKRLPATRK